jgi:diguanylate cyclase (GGDEF)-like protein/PAS domain S-box-containing protein
MVPNGGTALSPQDLFLTYAHETIESNLDPKTLLEMLLSKLSEVPPYSSFVVVRENKPWGTVSLVGSAGEQAELLSEGLAGERPRPWESVRTLALRRRFICLPSEILVGPGTERFDDDFRCVIVPLGNVVRGRSALVALLRPTEDVASRDHEYAVVLETLAHVMTLVLERLDAADLQMTLRRRAQITEMLTGALTDTTIPLESWLALVARCSTQVLSCCEARVIFMGDSSVATISAYESGDVQTIHLSAVPPGLAEYVVRTGRNVLGGSLRYGLIEPYEALRQASARHRSQSVVVTALRGVDGRVWGGIGGLDRRMFRFDEESLSALQEIAQVASAGISYRTSHVRGLLEADKNRSLAKAIDQIGDGVVIVGPAQRLIYANQTALNLFGYSLEEITAIPSMKLIDERDQQILFRSDIYASLNRGEKLEIDLLSRRKDGTTFLGGYSIIGQFSSEGKAVGWTCNLRDYTSRAAREDTLRQQAEIDHLTSVLSRRGFVTRVDNFLRERRDGDDYLSLIYVDLNGFKAVNDSYGHAAGDELLRVVASRLKSGLKDTDFLGRLGGDEFVVALVELASSHDGHAVAKRLEARLSATPVTIGNEQIFVTASLGVATSKVATANVDLLVHRADKAMYRTKHGRGMTVEQNRQAASDTRRIEDLRLALSTKERMSRELRPRVSAIISIPQQEILGHLVEMEWQQPEGATVSLTDLPSSVYDTQLVTKFDRLALDAIWGALQGEKGSLGTPPSEIFLTVNMQSLSDIGFTRALIRAKYRWDSAGVSKVTLLLAAKTGQRAVDSRSLRHCAMLAEGGCELGLTTPFSLPYFLNSLDQVPLRWVLVRWSRFSSTNGVVVAHLLRGIATAFEGIGTKLLVVDTPPGHDGALESLGVHAVTHVELPQDTLSTSKDDLR